MVCVIAHEKVYWNRPTFKAPRLELKPIVAGKPAAPGLTRNHR
jgi:hypothetical protein